MSSVVYYPKSINWSQSGLDTDQSNYQPFELMPKYRRKKKQPTVPYNKKENSTSKEPTTDEAEDETLVCSKCSKSVEKILQCDNCTTVHVKMLVKICGWL